jgi:hypothetical protein
MLIQFYYNINKFFIIEFEVLHESKENSGGSEINSNGINYNFIKYIFTIL